MPKTPKASANTIVMRATPAEIFDVLEDASSYPDWLVGAQRITAVDDDWPAVGARFCHRIGFGPLALPGSTSIRHIDRPGELVLGAGMGILGEAVVHFRLREVEGGTEVSLHETLARGPARVAAQLARPPISTALWGRNAVSLTSLEKLVTAQVPHPHEPGNNTSGETPPRNPHADSA